jgi:hypothetical protein
LAMNGFMTRPRDKDTLIATEIDERIILLVELLKKPVRRACATG